MNLTVSQSNDLIDALIDAFLDESELALMVRRELGTRLNSIVQNAKTYEEAVTKLVDWAEAEGKVLELIIGSSRRKSGNVELQNFVLDNLALLFENTFEGITIELILELAKIFKKIDRLKPILDSLFEVEGINRTDIEVHKDKGIDFLYADEENNALRIYFIFEILKMYPYGDNLDWPNVLEFVENVCAKPLKDEVIQDLNAWIQKAIDLYGFKNLAAATGAFDDSFSEIRDDVTDVALMVMISEKKPKGKDDLCNCYLWACVQAYKTENFKGTSLGLVDVDFCEASSLEGKPCIFTEIDQEIKTLIDKTVSKIFNAFDMPLDLSVEVFLPLKWMATAVDHWMTGEFDERMGSNYRTTIRSYERNFRPQLKFSFLRFWRNTYEPLLDKEIQFHELNERYIAHVKSTCDALDMKKLQKKIGLKMTSPPPQEQNGKFFLPLIKADIPLAVWTRCDSVPSIESEKWHSTLDTFFDWHALRNRMMLLERVRQRREDAYMLTDPQDDLGYHLSILYDDPYRVPEKSLLDER